MDLTWGLVVAIILCFTFPVFARWAERGGYFPAWISSIVACYGVGILVSNLHLLPLGEDAGELLEGVAGVAMLFGLPLLLFAVRLRESWRTAGGMLLGFALCALSGMLCTYLTASYFAGGLPEAPKVAGMLVGLYTGGTPNVQSIALALKAPIDYIVLVQASDVLLGGAYLIGLITVLPAIYAKFFRKDECGTEPADVSEVHKRIDAKLQLWQFGVATGVALVSLGVTALIGWGSVDMTLLMLSLTTFSLAVGTWAQNQDAGVIDGARTRVQCGVLDSRATGSTTPSPHWLDASYPLGEYFVLVFCVALGLLVNFQELADRGGAVLRFSAIALSSTTLLHLLLCRFFNLTRDTAILSSVAGFYGPVFVAQVAASLNNKRLLAAGIAVSLVGFGVGNYLGIGMAWLLD